MPRNSVTGESQFHGLSDQSAAAVATGASGTIATANLDISRVSPAAARTACILQAGTSLGQRVTVVNEAAAGSGFSITFDVVGTSLVADGVTSVIAATNARTFVWTGASWFPCK
jgi:hypothetical protein